MATFSTASKNAANDARCALVSGGFLRLYDSGRANLIAQFALATPAFTASSGGVAAVVPVSPATVAFTGTIAEYAVFASDGTTEHWGGTSVALTPGPAEVVIDGPSLAVTSGETAVLTAHNVTQG